LPLWPGNWISDHVTFGIWTWKWQYMKWCCFYKEVSVYILSRANSFDCTLLKRCLCQVSDNHSFCLVMMLQEWCLVRWRVCIHNLTMCWAVSLSRFGTSSKMDLLLGLLWFVFTMWWLEISQGLIKLGLRKIWWLMKYKICECRLYFLTTHMVLIVVEIPLLFQIWPFNNSRSVFCFFVGGQANKCSKLLLEQH